MVLRIFGYDDFLSLGCVVYCCDGGGDGGVYEVELVPVDYLLLRFDVVAQVDGIPHLWSLIFVVECHVVVMGEVEWVCSYE